MVPPSLKMGAGPSTLTRWVAALKPLGTWDLSTQSLVSWKLLQLPNCSPVAGQLPTPSPLLTHPRWWDINFKKSIEGQERKGQGMGKHCP